MHRLRAPLEVFFWSRAAIWLTAILGYAVLEARYAQPLHPPTNSPPAPVDVGWATDMWARWDGGWFVHIAQHGYTDPKTTTAFFPAYPMLVRAFGWVIGRHYVAAGVAISLLACAAAFVLLYELARSLIGDDAAMRGLIYLAVFPAALFLGAVYSESLYLLLSVAAFLAATRNRWWLAGAVAGLAILTRPSGVMLIPALALFAWRTQPRLRALTGVALSIPIAAVWPVWLWAVFGRPLEFLTAERNEWNRHLSAAGPFGGLWDGIVAGWNGIAQLVAGGQHFDPSVDQVQAAGLNLECLAALVFALALGVVAWRVLGVPYGLFVLLSVALPLASPARIYPLLSMPRFVLGVFPIFIALATVTKRPRTIAIVIAVFAMLLGLDIARWVEWQFVA